MLSRLLRPVLLAALLVCASTAAFGQIRPLHLDPEVAAALTENSGLELLVQLDRESVAAFKGNRIAQLAALKARLADEIAVQSGRLLEQPTRYRHLPLMLVEADAAQLRALAQRPEIRGLFVSRQRRAYLTSSLPFFGATTLHEQGYTGAQTAVAILDTGVQYWNGYFGDCPEPGANGCSVAEFVNFTTEDDTQTATYNPHGSNVAGIVLGVAPDTTILSLNVFHFSEMAGAHVAEDQDILEALDWVAEHKQEYNIVSVNMSLGSEREDANPCNGTPFEDAVTTLYEDYDVLCAIASGNEATADSLGEPACVTNAVSVGAHFDTDVSWVVSMSCTHLYGVAGEMVCFSNRNGSLDLVAPGVWVTAGGFADYSGTSMAAPHVAGAIALMQELWTRNFGAPLSAAEAQRRLLMDSGSILSEGWSYMRLNLDTTRMAKWERLLMFKAYNREKSEAAILDTPQAFSIRAQTPPQPGQSFVAGAPYLLLEISHPAPQEVEVTLIAPNGEQATVALPRGESNFNGVIGRDLFPGAFAALASAGPGEWTLELSDTKPGANGYYLSATLFWPQEGCEPACDGRVCGDNGCGGSCGDCAQGQTCSEYGDCLSEGEACAGDSCDTVLEIPARPATYSGATTICRYDDKGSCGGGNSPDRIYSFTLNSSQPFSATLSADFDAILVLRKDRCKRGLELFCSIANSEGRTSIETELGPGTYYLMVDGSDYGKTFGSYDLTLDVCEPDCDGRVCGDDGCGGLCGDCDTGDVCEAESGSCCTPDCEGADICAANGCGGVCRCLADACDPEADGASCFENVVLVCTEGLWQVQTDCGDTQQVCMDGLCVDAPDGDADPDEDPETDGDVVDGDDEPLGGGSDGGCASLPAAAAGGLWAMVLLLALEAFRRRRGRAV
jgi:subtilisin family serine protease